jgi:hypothetical protein
VSHEDPRTIHLQRQHERRIAEALELLDERDVLREAEAIIDAEYHRTKEHS